MKQSITKEQWNELDNKEVQTLLIGLVYETDYPWKIISIGQMTEYLGDDLKKIERDYDSLHMEDGYEDRIYYEVFLKNCSFSSWSELVDALWEAVKYKLNGDGLIIK